MNLKNIYDLIGGEIINKDNTNTSQFTGIKPLGLATESDVVFLFQKFQPALKQSQN